MIAIPIRPSRLTARAVPASQPRPGQKTIMRMLLPTQAMPNCIPMQPRRKVWPKSLRGRLENVSDVEVNERCPVGSAGNVGCQRPFVGDLTGFLTHGNLLQAEQHGGGSDAVADRNETAGSRVTMCSPHWRWRYRDRCQRRPYAAVRTRHRTRPAGGRAFAGQLPAACA